jgi:phosphoserine phosphatase RsbU/P
MPTIMVLNGPNAPAVFTITDGATLGRDPSADIQIPAPVVSRRHVQFAIDGETVWLQDLGSFNGTTVNGVKVTARRKLVDGDVIGMSDVTVRFCATGAAQTPPTRPASRLDVGPPTDRLGVLRTPLLKLAEDEKATKEAFSVDVTGVFSASALMDTKLAPAEQVAALQKRLRLAFEVSQALAVVKEKDELFAKILEKLLEAFPQADRGYIFLGPSVDQLVPAMTRERRPGGGGGPPTISRTIASKVFEQKKAILCHDASRDERFAGALSIASLDLAAFMVAPLLYRDEVYGFIQLQAKKFLSQDDLNLLAGLASSAAVFLKNLQLFESVAREVKEREALHSELRIASRIQAQLLPKVEPTVGWLELSGHMKTAKEVGGDYYDYLLGPKGELHVVIGDVSGKGVPAGLVMVMARSILHSLVSREAADPRAIAIETNRLLKKDLKPGMFLSMLIALCDEERHALRFAGCGHERPLVYRAATRTVEQVELKGTVLGVVPDISGRVSQVDVALAPGDQLLLYTDGVSEAMDVAGQQYSVARLMKTLAAHGALPPAELIQTIEKDLSRHALGRDQHDDITMIALRRRT